MLEVVKHFLGMCGEPHPSILSVLIYNVGLEQQYYYIIYQLKQFYDKIKP